MDSIPRRKFIQISAAAALYFPLTISGRGKMIKKKNNSIRLGGSIFKEVADDPIEWVKEHRKWGYSAAYCPVNANASTEIVRAFENEANRANLLIAEVGAWSNPINPDPKKQKEAITYCCEQLDLADHIGASCCVNIAGSRNAEEWDGPHADNLTENTFDLIVEVTRQIIDSVKPSRTYFTLEPMPWIFPNSVKSYEKLLKAINRKRFAVHFDPVNLINSPENYYNNAQIIREAFKTLGPYIKSCHGKDTIMKSELTTHISEIRPGLGNLDYPVFLSELSRLSEVPLMLEHLDDPNDYKMSIAFLRQISQKNGLNFLSLE